MTNLNENPASKQPPAGAKQALETRRRISLVILTTAILVGLVTLLQPADEAAAVRHESILLPLPPASEAATAVSEHEPAEPANAEQNEEVERPWHQATVRSGDSLSALFARHGISANDLHLLMQSDRAADNALRQIFPGQTLRFQLDDEGRLHALQYARNRLTTLTFSRQDDGFAAQQEVKQTETRLAYSNATITRSFFLAGQQAGLSDGLIMDLATLFGWDVDFALDIRSGDSFTVLYEQTWLDGERLADNSILAAEFINQGRSYHAIRHVNDEGEAHFYTPKGLSMRKAFLRAPVDFRRISSGFRPQRHHPILGVKRPHRGVDYAAATGTPIRASGDGRIEFIGTKGGYGKTIIVQHGGAYRTLYAHMSRFNTQLRTGTRVKQGQTIGYVGQTGMATGPHLHYEFLVNGVHHNPLTVKLPTADPIDKKYREPFLQQAQARMAQLEAVKQTQLAMDAH